MDQDQRDPRDWPEGEKPEDAADEALSEEAPPPPPDEPASEPEAGRRGASGSRPPSRMGCGREARRRRGGRELAEPGRGALLRRGSA